MIGDEHAVPIFYAGALTLSMDVLSIHGFMRVQELRIWIKAEAAGDGSGLFRWMRPIRRCIL